MDDTVRVRSILQVNEHLVLATADENGTPWVTPVSFAFDDKNTLYWVSSKDSRHSSNIRARADVAIVIYMTGTTSDALYVEAKARELLDEQEIMSAIKIRNTDKQPDKFRVKTVADVSGEASWRIYKAIPKIMYVRELTDVRGQAVTTRRKVS